MAEGQEITNAVLAEQIKGLVKLTDERFGSMDKTLNRIELSNQHFVTKTELEETKKDFTASIKRIEDGFVKHNEADVISFGGLTKEQQATRDTIKTWIGGLAVIVVIFPIIVTLALHYWFHVG